MNGRHHIIANVATVSIVDTGLKIIAKVSDTDIYRSFHNFLFSRSIIGTEPAVNKIFTNIASAAVCAALFIVGSLLPDIDQEKSTLGKIIHIPVQHRTWTHTAWVVIVLAILSIFLPCLFWLCFGYTLHIFYDSLSKGGICWFYPISQYRTWASGAQVKKNHKIYLYRTGETSELITTMLVTLVGTSMLIYNIYLTVSSFDLPSP